MTSDHSITVYRAFDREPIATLDRTPFDMVNGWLDEMANLHQSRSCLPAYRRRDILLRLSELMRAESEELAMNIALEGGKPLTDARVYASERFCDQSEGRIFHGLVSFQDTFLTGPQFEYRIERFARPRQMSLPKALITGG